MASRIAQAAVVLRTVRATTCTMMSATRSSTARPLCCCEQASANVNLRVRVPTQPWKCTADWPTKSRRGAALRVGAGGTGPGDAAGEDTPAAQRRLQPKRRTLADPALNNAPAPPSRAGTLNRGSTGGRPTRAVGDGTRHQAHPNSQNLGTGATAAPGMTPEQQSVAASRQAGEPSTSRHRAGPPASSSGGGGRPDTFRSTQLKVDLGGIVAPRGGWISSKVVAAWPALPQGPRRDVHVSMFACAGGVGVGASPLYRGDA